VDTKLNGASSAFNRMLTGQNMFLTDFRYESTTGSGTVGLGTDFPSKILRFTLADHPDGMLVCQKGAFLASSHPNVAIEVQFTKSLTAGFFGGQGFVLQKLSGEGDVLIKGGGTIVKRQLRDGETLRVTSGSIVALESTIQYDAQMMPGVTNAVFGGEGLFVTTLTGPGHVWLQGLPPDRMIAEIARRVPSGGGGIGLGIPIGIGGGGGGSGGDVGGGAADVGTASDGAAAAGAAGEAALEADRTATIASSGVSSTDSSIHDSAAVDSESPSALFGDVASPVSHASSQTAPGPNSDTWESPLYNDASAPAAQLYDDTTSAGNSSEPSFDDEFSVENPMDDGASTSISDGELFDDTVSSSTEEAVETGKSMFRQIWDFFNDQE
jgi:uncharacterized protein (AIM24 family)